MELITILASLLTTILSILGSFYIATSIHYKNERKKQKILLFSELMASRHELVRDNKSHSISSEQFIYELNKVFAVFYDSEEVKQALMSFHIDKINTDANIKNLIIAICNDLEIDIKTIPDGFLENPFISNSNI